MEGNSCGFGQVSTALSYPANPRKPRSDENNRQSRTRRAWKAVRACDTWGTNTFNEPCVMLWSHAYGCPAGPLQCFGDLTIVERPSVISSNNIV